MSEFKKEVVTISFEDGEDGYASVVPRKVNGEILCNAGGKREGTFSVCKKVIYSFGRRRWKCRLKEDLEKKYPEFDFKLA